MQCILCVVERSHAGWRCRLQAQLSELEAAFEEASTCTSLHGALVLALGVANRLRLQGAWPHFREDGSQPDLTTMITRALLLTAAPAVLDTRTFGPAQSQLVHLVVAMCALAAGIALPLHAARPDR